MKWFPSDCKFGDVIRVKVGSLYHYGIFVSEDEVIQFGERPDRHPDNAAEIIVCTTTVDSFSGGDIVEVAVWERTERKKKRSPAEIVSIARSRLGEGNYDILHNNCEHFVNECVFGQKVSHDVEAIKKMWAARPLFKVFFAPVNQAIGSVVPAIRQKEIDGCSNDKVKNQKYSSWKLLEYALLRTFGKKIEDVKFSCNKFGKWNCDDCNFSISHSANLVCVALSNGTVGVDLENVSNFSDKFSDQPQREALLNKIATTREKDRNPDVRFLLETWTKKESAFKCRGKGNFAPSKTPTDGVLTKMFSVLNQEWCVAYCGEHCSRAEFYFVDGTEQKLNI